MRPVQTTITGQRQLGEKLKAFRQSLGLSLRDAEFYIKERTNGKVTFTTIGNLERGIQLADTNTLLLFAQSGYGGMDLQEMIDILTDRRLAVCETGGSYVA